MVTFLSSPEAIFERIESLSWSRILDSLNNHGFAITGQILTNEDCQVFQEMYSNNRFFRSRVIMQNHGYGRGEYQYFNYPLPSLVESLRQCFYPKLLGNANQWQVLLKNEKIFPTTLSEFLLECHGRGQIRPTPLLLKYEVNDFNCLHQDLYGTMTFPFQVAIVLSQPEKDFFGGEFTLVEQKPRSQSRIHVLRPQQGEAIIFAVNHRPVKGGRGIYRVIIKHGVSTIYSGQRYCLGIIFHDAA